MKNVLVIGACNIDYLAKIKDKTSMNDSNPSSIKISFGGVGKNIAHNLSLLGVNVSMLSAISKDINGQMISKHLEDLNIDYSNSIRSDYPSSIYISINNPDGDLLIGVNDMDIINEISYDYILKNLEYINSFDYVIIDSNLTKETLKYITENVKAPIICDSVSKIKAVKLKGLTNITLLKANKLEIEAITDIKDYKQACKALLKNNIGSILVSLGEEGIYYIDSNNEIEMPSIKCDVINTNGAGDSMLASIVYGFILNNDIKTNLKRAVQIASLTCQCEESVNSKIKEYKN